MEDEATSLVSEPMSSRLMEMIAAVRKHEPQHTPRIPKIKPFEHLLTTAVIERFMARVDVRGPDECWPYKKKYTGVENDSEQYGTFYVKPVRVAAHHLAFYLSHGSIDHSLEVMHTCDTPHCCNGAHLCQGTHAQNIRDSVLKGRFAQRKLRKRGRTIQFSQLEALAIRQLYRDGYTYAHIAKEFQTTGQTISRIVNYKTPYTK